MRADPEQVRVLDGTQVLARHPRSYDKGAQIEDAAHIQALLDDKRAARRHRGTDQLAHAAPASLTLLTQAAQRGDNLGAITRTMLQLLPRYGAAELQAAIEDALARGVPHPNAVRLALERRREEQQRPPPVVTLPEHLLQRDVFVPPHTLESYDPLLKENDDEQS